MHFIYFFSLSCQDKQLKTGSVKQIDSKILAEHKKKEREAAKQGKQPFYLKKCNVSSLLNVSSICGLLAPYFKAATDIKIPIQFSMEQIS